MAITNGYCTLAEIKEYLKITDSADDALLERAVEAASRQIDGFCGRFFYDSGSASARIYRPDSLWDLYVDDFSTSSGLIIKSDADDSGTFETTWTTADYELEPFNGVVDGIGGWPYYRIRALSSIQFPGNTFRAGTVEVTARWGWAAVPMDVENACLILATRLFKRKDSAEGVIGFNDFGSVRLSRTDPDAVALLNRYRRVGVG